MSRNAFERCAEEYNEREERMDIIRDGIKKRRASELIERDAILADHKSRILSTEKRAEKAEAENAALRFKSAAWEEFAVHMILCARCGESVESCDIGVELHSDALEAGRKV